MIPSPTRCFQFIKLQTRRWRSFPSGPDGPLHLVTDLVLAGAAGAQVLPADGSDRECDWSCAHAHTAMSVSPEAAVAPAHCEGAADRCVHTELGGHVQRLRCNLFCEETGGEIMIMRKNSWFLELL